jgi:peroxisome-assembly ATPase
MPPTDRRCIRRIAAARPRHNYFCSSSSSTIQDQWQARIAANVILHDRGQERAVKRLQRLHDAMQNYSNEPMRKHRTYQQLLLRWRQDRLDAPEIGIAQRSDLGVASPDGIGNDKHRTGNEKQELAVAKYNNELTRLLAEYSVFSSLPSIPRGLYLYGGVGSGKTMLMDIFYECVPCTAKVRYHFYDFLHTVHTKLHQQKTRYELQKKNEAVTHPTARSSFLDDALGKQRSHIEKVADELAASTSLLCIDEFQVLDVADAVILSQLLNSLFSNGTVLVTTSNRPVQDLYADGLHRYAQFTPCADLIARYCIEHKIQTPIDYRQLHNDEGSSKKGSGGANQVPVDSMYIHYSTDEGDATAMRSMDELLRERLMVSEIPPSKVELSHGRTFTVAPVFLLPSGKTLARFDFDTLCRSNYWSSADYRALARHCDVLAVDCVPCLSDSSRDHDATRRFILLMDEAYEAKIALVVSSTSAPGDLFHSTLTAMQNNDSKDLDIGSWENEMEVQDEDVAVTSGGHAVGALASVKDLRFAIRRAISRLVQMTSMEWWMELELMGVECRKENLHNDVMQVIK